MTSKVHPKQIGFPEGFRAMKGEKVKDISLVPMPIIAFIKYDGIRVFSTKHGLYTHELFRVPNRWIQEYFKDLRSIPGLDFEIILVDDNGIERPYSETQSAVMNEFAYMNRTNVQLRCFDTILSPIDQQVITFNPYDLRLSAAKTAIMNLKDPSILIAEHCYIKNTSELEVYYSYALCNKYEGLILRSFTGSYKFGRSTWITEKNFLKLKPFTDIEGEVVDFIEGLTNLNPAELSHAGLTRRSKSVANQVPNGVLGALIVNTVDFGLVRVGIGFTDEERLDIWLNQDKYRGAIITFKYQEHGTKDKPRSAIFKAFRHKYV